MAIYPGNCRTKICENVRQNFAAFLASCLQIFHHRSWCAHNLRSEEFQKPQPLLVSKKVRQYTPNFYGNTPPVCIAGPSWLLSLEEKGNPTVQLPFVLQYASHLYGSTLPASHLYGSTFEKILGVGVTGKFPIRVRFSFS